MDFWKRLKHLFTPPQCGAAAKNKDENEDESEQLIAHELISRTESEQVIYTEWELSDCKTDMLQWLQNQYTSYLQSPKQTDANIDFLVIPSVQGFVLHFDAQRWDCDDFLCLFDFFKNKIKSLGYVPQVSDSKTVRKGKKIETVQRHYLKPPSRLLQPQNEQSEQLYGNIMVCLSLINEKLVNLKFSATHYNDRNYLPPRPFVDLLAKICEI